jgi:hypothetical protein
MARTFKGLYPKIHNFDNLWLAWRNARRGGKRKCISTGEVPQQASEVLKTSEAWAN